MLRWVLLVLMGFVVVGAGSHEARATPTLGPAPIVAPLHFPMPAVPSFVPEDTDAEGADDDEGKWEVLFEAGVSITGGNSRTRDLDAEFEAKREWTLDTFTTYLRAEFGEQQSDQGMTERTRSRQTAGAKYEHKLNETLYIYALEDLERDSFKDIKLRSETFGGLGTELYKDDTHTVKGEVGLGYSSTNFFDSSGETGASGRLGEHWEWTISESWKLIQDFDLVSELEEIDDNFRTTSTVEVRNDLSEHLYLSFFAEHRYDAEPARESDGTKTNRQDYKFLVKIGYRF